MKRHVDSDSLESRREIPRRRTPGTRLRCLLIGVLAIAIAVLILFITVERHRFLGDTWSAEISSTVPVTTSSSAHSTVSNRTNHEVSTTAQNSRTTKITSRSSTSSMQNVNSSLLSTETLRELKKTIEFVDHKVDPCDDFYEYACGNSLKAKELREVPEFEKRAAEQYQDAFFKYYQSKETKPQPVSQMYEFFEDCVAVETNQTKRDFLAEVKKSIEKVGGIPALHGKKWKEVALPTVVDELLRWNFVPFLHFERLIAPLRYGFHFTIGDYHAEGDSSKTIRKESFERTITEMMQSDSGLSKNEMRQELDDLFKFIDGYDKILNAVRKKDRIEMEVSELANRFPMLNFSNIVRWSYPSMKYSRIRNDTKIVLKVKKDAMKKLSKFFKRTPNRVLVNHALLSFHIRLKHRMEKENLNNLDTSNCAKLAIDLNGFAMAHVYQKYHKTPTNATMSIVRNVVSAFRSNLEKYEWLDDETRKNAIEKLDNLEYFVGTPEPEKDMQEIYSTIPSLTGMGFLQKRLLLKQLSKNAENYIFERRNGRNLASSAANAYYNPLKNNFFINDGILFPPMFHANFSALLNYAGIGSVIGHEMIHGYDDIGSTFFTDGKQFDFFTNKSRAAYRRKMQCFIELYESTFADGTFLRENGEISLGENIADNGGLIQAFAAYNKFARANDALSQGYKGYSADQLFFIANAQKWCGKENPKNLHKKTHSLPKFRVNMNVMNHEEFANAFECPIGSKMNAPKSKECHVW